MQDVLITYEDYELLFSEFEDAQGAGLERFFMKFNNYDELIEISVKHAEQILEQLREGSEAYLTITTINLQ